jgi:hypothetical protein
MRGSGEGDSKIRLKLKEKEGKRPEHILRMNHPPALKRSPGAGKYLILEPTWRQTEGKNAELEQAASPAEAEILPVRSVDGNMKIRISEIDGSRPVPGADGVSHILGRFHAGYRGELHLTS